MKTIKNTKELEREHDVLIGNNDILNVKVRKLKRKIDAFDAEIRKNFIAAHHLKMELLNRPEYSVKESNDDNGI